MLVSFSVKNFRSFATEETISLVASKRFPDHKEHLCQIPDSEENVLRMAVLYGANGAGKSNLFKALSYLKSIVLMPRKKNSGTGRVFFRLGNLEKENSEFDLLFLVNAKLYRFGFKVDDDRIAEEWLVRVVGGRETVVYERITDKDGKVSIKINGLKKADEKLKALATVGGPPNQSFLATIRATLNPSDYNSELHAIIDWFDESLQLIAPEATFGSLAHLLNTDSSFREFASEFLKAASTGVDHLNVHKKEVTEDELRVLLPESTVTKILNDLEEDGIAVFVRKEGYELWIEKGTGTHFYSLTIQAAHTSQNGKEIPLDLSEESDGTLRLLNLIPALHYLKTKPTIFFIDEIDRSMHPMLSWKFLEFFLKTCLEGQVIVTTHESNLLDLDLLRRDEIWFAEKDSTSATRLYSLNDFKVRQDLEIRKHYLQGRFGAVPFLGNIDRLPSEKELIK